MGDVQRLLFECRFMAFTVIGHEPRADEPAMVSCNTSFKLTREVDSTHNKPSGAKRQRSGQNARTGDGNKPTS
jgi:hypothetical protein